MDNDHFTDNHKSSFSEQVSSNRLYHFSRNLIRFSIVLIVIFLLFSITGNDETQIAYASENLTDLELESTNLYAINDSSTNQTSITSNPSLELIDPSGTVTSWSGYPIPGLTVSAWQGTELINQTVTDGNGAYNLDLTPGTYNLTAGGIATGGEEQKEYLTQTQQIDVQEPVTVNFQGMLLKNSVYGVITDENGNPLPYTMAEVYDNESNCIDDNDAGTDGNYKLDLNYYFSQQDPSVTSGNFWVVFYGDQFLEQEFNVQVNRDEAYRLDVVMQNATILQGTVTGQSTAIDDGTYKTSEVIMYFTDPNGNEGTDYCSIGHTKNYYFEVDPSLVTVHHIGMAVYGYQDYYQPISLTSGQVNLHNITLVEKGIITVNVTNSTNQPLSGASVSVQSDSFNYLLYTDTDGMLSFAVEDDDWTVCASHPNYNKVVEYLNVSGGGIHQINITLVKKDLPVTLEGYVTDSVTGTPISNCYVMMEFSNGEYQYVDTMTDTDGHYVFDSSSYEGIFYSGLNVNLNAEKQDYNPYSTSFILPDGLFIHNISLVHDTVLWGSVTDPDGNVVYTDVTLSYTHEGETIEESVSVDEGGYYRFEGINSADDSQYNLSAQHPFYLPYQTTPNVLPNQSTQHDMIMNYYSGAVTVNILNTQGQCLNGVTVSIGNESFAIVKTTNSTGSTTFQHIPDGNWTIEANYAGYASATTVVSISGGSSEQLTLTLIQQGLPVTMEGYVTDAVDGTPLPNAQIYFWPSSHPTQTNIYTKTDSNGYYKFTSVQFSEFVSGLSGVLDVRPFQHEKPRIFMTIGEGPLIQYDLQLNPYTGSITVHLIDSTNNQPVPGLTVDLGGDEDQETTSDANGIATFEKVGPSEWWEVVVWSSSNNYYYWDGYYYPLQEGEHLDINVFLVPTTVSAIIEGTVVDDTNNVVPGARAELSFINGNWIYTWALKTTDVYGKFLMDLDNTANLMRVTISKTGYQTAVYDFNPTDLPINQIFVLQPDLSLTTPVDGYVKDFLENPLSGVSVDFYRGGTVFQTASTNPAGYYNINLPVGVYQMYVHQTDFITQNQGFTIFYGNGHQFNYTLLKNSSLYGKIEGNTTSLYDCNIPISGATIKLYNNSNLIDSTNSNVNGYFQTNSISSGEYIIQLQAIGYETLIYPITINETATYQYFMLQPTASCAVHGYVTNKYTGTPINANVTFYYGEGIHIETTTDSNGFYSFTNLSPGYYYLEFSATDYIQKSEVGVQVDVGEDAELNQALEPIIPSTIEGTVNSWVGPVTGATVTLDNTITHLTGLDGKFIFTPVITGLHEISVDKNGVQSTWYGWIKNNATETISIYLYARVLDTNPIKDSSVQNLEQIKVRVFETRPDLDAASISVSSPNGVISGSVTRANDWIIFTPDVGALTSHGLYTVTTTIPSELFNTFGFYYYPITNNPPIVQIVSPSSGSFFRNPTSISISATIQNDEGNGISPNSQIYIDGIALPTTLSGRQITATNTNYLGQGWHTIRAVVVDNQGLTGETSCEIFVSHGTPYFSNINATDVFSYYHDNMHIEADISEPIQSAYVTFDGYPNYSLTLGSFDEKIDAYWNGIIVTSSWDHAVHPDGPVTFTIHGQGRDGVWFTTATGSSKIDSTPPVITFNNSFSNSHDSEIKGSISDYCGIFDLNASSSGGIIQKSFTNENFNLKLHVDADDKYTITIDVVDKAGNTASASKTIYVDTVNPNIQFITPDAGSEITPGQPISFRLEDDFSGLQLDYQYPNYPFYPQNYDVLLDGVSKKDQIAFSQTSNMWWQHFENYNPTRGYETALIAIIGTYDPRLHGYLTDGLHELKINLTDLAGNEIVRILSFSSITKNPEAAEKDMDMKANENDQTLWTSFDVKDNNDAGFTTQMYLDGSVVPESSSFISTGPKQGVISYTLVRNFTPGPHTIKLVLTDGLGLNTSVDTGFYFDLRVGVPTSGYTASTDYVANMAPNNIYDFHQDSLLSNVYFQPGSQAIYGFCEIFAPSATSGDPRLPMGFQGAITTVQLAPVDASTTSHLSLWMTDIIDDHNCFWGWSDSISVYFYDGSQTTPTIDTRLDILDDSIIYAHHEAPWGNVAGYIDNYVATATGADGKTWKEYIVAIPDGLDKSHLSVIIVWRAVNWNSWGSWVGNHISSKVDGLEFFTPLVDQVYPANKATDVKVSSIVSAHFRMPMDQNMFTNDYFYLLDSKGNKAFAANNYNSATGWGNMVPYIELDCKTKYTAYISPEIRTIYGRILPEPSPYIWTFTTKKDGSAKWQTIWYNGEQYDIYVTYGTGYNGYIPNYISPSTIQYQTGAPITGIYIFKQGYEIADMDLKKIILQAAQRKAFYESIILANYGRLISQSSIDWADNGANAMSGDFIYYLTYILPGGNSNQVPFASDIIEDTISTALSDGSTPYQIPGALSQSLSWFSTLVSTCDNINTFIGALQKVKPTGLGTTISESCAGDVLEVAQLVSDELTFQKDLWEFVYETMWIIEVVDQYRDELSYIKSHTSGATNIAIDDMLNTNSYTVKQMVAQKIAEHIGTQTVSFMREAVWEGIKNYGPYGKALYYICKGFNFVVDKLGIMDVHSKCHIALDQADAEANFYNAWKSAIVSLSYTNQVTPDDLSLVSTSSKLRYDTAGDFYNTLAAACEIAKNWPTSDTSSYNSVLPYYYSTTNDDHTRASYLIPEMLTSNSDINALFALIKPGTAGKPGHIQIRVHSPVALLVTDELGRHIGYDPVTGQNVNDFAPDGGYTGPYTEPQAISIPAMVGQLTIQAFGTGNGSFTIELETYDDNYLLISGSTWNGTAETGVTQIFTLIVDEYGDVFPVDSHPPEITVTGVTDGACYISTISPQITVTDSNLEGWFATLNGNIYTGEPITGEGVYSIFIRATDGINVVYKTIKFSIDLTAPQISLLGFEDNGFYPYVHPYLNVVDDNLAIVYLNLDGNPFNTNIVNAEGQHTVTGTATDGAGHQSSVSGSFTIDNTIPLIDIFGLVNGTVYQGGVTPNINISDLNLLLSNFTLDGNTYNNGNAILNTLRHHLIIDAVDKAGNHATREIWFIVIPNGGVIITDAGGTTNSGSTSLNFPTGAVNNATAVTINQLSEISDNPTNFLFAGQAFDVTAVNLEDGTETNQLNQPVVITIHYSDSDVEGLDENSLVIFYWDPTTSTWKPLSCTVDIQNNIITGTTGHFSTFALMGTVKQEPSNPQNPENHPIQTTPTTLQNSGTTQNSGSISGYPTPNLLILAPLTIQSQSTAATVPAQQQSNGKTTSGVSNWVIYALVFLLAVLLIALLSRRIIKS